MITRNATAICAAIFLVTISSQANASLCNDGKHCGQIETIKTHQKHVRIKPHSVKRPKAIQVASIGNEPISEAPVGLVAQAERYLGQTAHQVGVRSTLWCSAFIRKLTNASGVDDRAISWLSKPRTSPAIGAIAVMRHHIGIVKSFDRSGNPILISGNHRHRVGIGAYPKHRILAYVKA